MTFRFAAKVSSLVVTAIFLGASGKAEAATKTLSGHVPEIVKTLRATGEAPGEAKLELAIGLSLRDPQGLSNFLAAVYDRTSPQYRHYLTPEEFTERFGPTEADYQAVVNFAKASGFTIAATHADRMLLEVSAVAGDAERAFHVVLRRYSHPTEARTFFAPDREPTLDASLRIADVAGLTDYIKPHPKNLRARALGPNARRAKNTSRDGSGPNGNFIGSDYRQAYIPGVTLTGTGQTLGLFEYDNYYAGDIPAYETAADLIHPPPVKTVFLDHYNGVQGSGNGEVALDIETAMSMAPGLSAIVSFEAPQSAAASVLLSAMASSNSIKQFSCSWGFGSIPATTIDTYFQKMAAQGQSFFDACGDSGAFTGAIPQPSDDPYITQVGGTALLTANANGPWSGEITWNAPDYGDASSGGISTSYPLPSWQTGVATAANQGSTANRNTPDVAAVADNIFIVADNGQDETTGGTSASSPLWAAFTALVNQQAVATGHGTVGFVNPALYAFYNSLNYAANFDDITFGNSTNSGSPDAFFATPGYDLCTGLGSPSGGSLLLALASPDDLAIAPGRGFAANGPAGGPFNVTSASMTVTNEGSSSLNWSVGNIPSWLSVSPLSGSLAAASASSVNVSLNAAASALAVGVYTADLWFTNAGSGVAQLRQFTTQVGQNIVHDGGFETGDFAYWTATGLYPGGAYLVDDAGGYTGYTPHSGLYFAALGESNAVSYLSQPLPMTPGQAYLISFWLDDPTGDTPNQFTAELTTSTATNVLFQEIDLSAFDWKNLQFLAVATSSPTQLQFVAQDDSDYLLLDDVSVTPIPIPTIQSIQQSGSSAQITWLTLPGLQYEVQYTPTLSPPQWVNLGSPLIASGGSDSVTESIGAGTQGYYRIVMLSTL